jgi:putative transposase
MSDKFQNKYRIDSMRLKGYDYRNDGSYFITICTHNRQQFFGTCIDGQMLLSPIGEIAYRCWNEIPDHFPNAAIGAFIIMPDHMHGILSVQMLHATSPPQSIIPPQSSIGLKGKPDGFYQEISPKTGSISTMIRSYKSAVSKYSRPINTKFQWQSLFYDHIIRD